MTFTNEAVASTSMSISVVILTVLVDSGIPTPLTLCTSPCLTMSE